MAAIDLNLCKSADNHRPFEFASDGRSTRVSSFHFVDSLFFQPKRRTTNEWIHLPLMTFMDNKSNRTVTAIFSLPLNHSASNVVSMCKSSPLHSVTWWQNLWQKLTIRVIHWRQPSRVNRPMKSNSTDEKMKRRQNFELFGASSPNRRPPPAEVCERLNGVHRATAHFWPPPAGWLAAVPQSHLTLDCWAAPRQRWKEAQFLLTSHWFISLEFSSSKQRAPTQKCWHGLCNREGYQWCICY